MVARVNVPGVGPMFFPDDMSDEDIKARVNDTISGMKRAIPEPTPSGKSVASKDFSDPQREILDTIAGTESPDYNTLYGGRKVADLSKHPGIDVPITSGPNVGKTSSAFGRYQFIEPTWKEQANKLGLKDMSPESQDRAAWNLASETYKGKTGKDLADDWANSDPAARKGILSNLAGVWTSLPSGIEQNRKYAGGQKFQGNAKDLPTSELLKGGWERGVEGMKGTFFDLIPSLGASAIGKDEYAREQLEEYKKRMEEVEEANPTAYKSYKDVESPGQALDYAAETLGEVGPDIASFMLGSGAGSTLGKAAARKALRSEIEGHAARYAERNGLEEAAKNEYSERLMDRALHGSLGQHTVGKAAGFGANTGTAVAAGAMNIPETFHQVYEDTGELHPGVAAAWGGVKSALDTIVPARVWGQLTGAAKDRMAAQILKDTDIVPTSWKRGFITEAAKTGAAEGLTEGMQQAIDNMASNYAGAHKDVLEGTLDSAIRGAIGGGAMGRTRSYR